MWKCYFPFKLRLTRSGHWLLPCSRFTAAQMPLRQTGTAADRLVPKDEGQIALNASASSGSEAKGQDTAATGSDVPGAASSSH